MTERALPRALAKRCARSFATGPKNAGAPWRRLGATVMKLVVAYIRHEAFEPIRRQLLELGFPSLSVTEVKGSGRQRGITEQFRGGAAVTSDMRPKLKLECAVAAADVQTIVEAILRHARTGAIGDGKVLVLPVEQAYRIRTGECGAQALQAQAGAAAAV